MNSIKIYVFTPIQFIDEFGSVKEDIIKKTSNNKKSIYDEKWVDLSDENDYFGLGIQNDLINTFFNEKNFNTHYLNTRLPTIKNEYKGCEYTISFYLFSTEGYNYLIVSEIVFQDFKINLDLTLLFKDRNLFKTLGVEEDFKKTNITLIKQICDDLQNISIKVKGKKCFKITPDSSYPLVISDEKMVSNYKNVLKKDESQSQRETISSICEDYEGSYVHLGWNYSFVLNIPEKYENSYLCMIAFLQMYYYQLRYYKNNFVNKINKIVSQDNINENSLDDFEKEKLAFHKYLLKYKTYKSGLKPMIHEDFEFVEKLWHINEDIEIINKSFDAHKNFADRKYQSTNEKMNRNVNFGLGLIAILQIATIFSTMVDFYTLKNNSGNQFITSVYIVITLTLFLIPFVLKPLFRSIWTKLKK